MRSKTMVRRLDDAPPRNARRRLGDAGEQRVAADLAARGWPILARNWRCRMGELDIVAMDGTTLVAVEVKTRTRGGWAHPADAVTAAKLARLRRLAAAWVQQWRESGSDGSGLGGWEAIRIDVVSVVADDERIEIVEHLYGVDQ